MPEGSPHTEAQHSEGAPPPTQQEGEQTQQHGGKQLEGGESTQHAQEEQHSHSTQQDRTQESPQQPAGHHQQQPEKAPSATSTSLLANGGSYRLHNRGSTNAAVVAASPFFHQNQDENGLLPRVKLDTLLQQIQLDSNTTSTDTSEVVQVVAGTATALSFDQTMAIVSMLQSSLQPSTSYTTFKPDSTGSISHTPLRRMLKQGYMTTGNVDARDGAVISYLHKLQEHRKVCVDAGRYEEARMTAERLASLRTQQVERLRQGLVSNQLREQAELSRVFAEETEKVEKLWHKRVKEYEECFAKSVDDFRALHEQQQQQLNEQLRERLQQSPRPSKGYLEQRCREDRLAAASEYKLASQVQIAASRKRQMDIKEAHLKFEADHAIRLAKLDAKQKVELEALLQRGARGRDELELKRLSEVEKKVLRFKALLTELQSLHRLELVQLESFLDAQVQAGKAIPLKSSDAYVSRRRREALLADV